jgi:DNA replicative helicase MCM subunit Mcm2 (Cdc46/Mcm family)
MDGILCIIIININNTQTSCTTGHDVLSIELMRRYIEYAKQYIHPTLSIAAAKVLQLQYLSMRAQSALGRSTPVTTRHLESLIRSAH